MAELKEIDINAPRITSGSPDCVDLSDDEDLRRKDPNVKHIIRETTAISSEENLSAQIKDALSGEKSKHQEEGKIEVSQEQKMRMEINKAAARAKRNFKLCEERVTEAKGNSSIEVSISS